VHVTVPIDSDTGAARALRDLAALATRSAADLGPAVDALARRTGEVLEAGGTLLFCGNGGSAADAQHLAAEYVVRFQRERRALPALALTTDTSVLTAGGNDYGFEEVFARQVRALGRRGDLLFLHSTSGNSPNLIKAAEAARETGVETVAILARDGGALRGLADHTVIVPTEVTARAQEIHLAIGHIICEQVDQMFATRGEAQG
jgi:D-sedoheptulose 7-phosphate isomerase